MSSFTGIAVSRTHNRSNEITDVDTVYTGEDPTYDKNGNTTLIHRPASSARTYVYDAWNQLVEVKFGGVVLLQYRYDGLGRRVSELIDGTEYYYSLDWQLLAERDGTTATDKTLREYVWGVEYIDEIIERDEDKNADGDTRDAADESLFYVQDVNWNVHTLVDESGAAAERVLYDPYGLPSFFDGSWGTRTSSAYANRVLFTGRLWTDTSFSYEYRQREYSPYLGRFLQRDPIGIWEDGDNAGNGYAYVGSDPANRIDTWGMRGEEEDAARTASFQEADKKVLDLCTKLCEDLKGGYKRRGYPSGAAAQARLKPDLTKVEWEYVDPPYHIPCDATLKIAETIEVDTGGKLTIKPGAAGTTVIEAEFHAGLKRTMTVETTIASNGLEKKMYLFVLKGAVKVVFYKYIWIPFKKITWGHREGLGWGALEHGWCECIRECPDPCGKEKGTEEKKEPPVTP